jgi:quinol monooxygenase YgiN
MSEPLIVVARVRAKAGQEARLRHELQGLVSPTRAEAGCLRYDLHESKTEPGWFLFYEMWKSDADLDKHFQTPYLKAFFQMAPELTDGRSEVTKWKKFE